MSAIVVAGVPVRDGSALLARRSASRAQHPGVWDAAGGHSEDGESPEATLVRELGEELGIVPTAYRFVAIIPAPEPALRGELPCHLYCVTGWEGEPRNLQPHEHDEIAWFTPGEAERLDLAAPEYVGLLRAMIAVTVQGAP